MMKKCTNFKCGYHQSYSSKCQACDSSLDIHCTLTTPDSCDVCVRKDQVNCIIKKEDTYEQILERLRRTGKKD